MVRERLSKDMRREQIQETAKRLFSENGFVNTTMDEIRAETGLSAGGLYYHYRNTYDILYDLMVNGNTYREGVIREAVEDAGGDITPAVFAEIVADKMVADNAFIPIYAMFLSEIKNDDKLMTLFEQLKRTSIENFKKLLTDTGYVPPSQEDFDFITDLINSVVLGCELLGARENFVQNRASLVLMLEAYFSKIEKKKGSSDGQQ